MDIDDCLARLGAATVPDLSAIDGAVLVTQARVEARQTRAMLGMAMVAALGIGVVGGMQAPAKENPSLLAFGPAPSLTPLIGLGQP